MSTSNNITVLCVHGLLCTVGGQQLDVRLPVSWSAPGKNDGTGFHIVDEKVNDSTSVIKLQGMHMPLPFIAMNTCLDSSNLVVMYQCCQLVLPDSVNVAKDFVTHPEAVVVETGSLCLPYFLLSSARSCSHLRQVHTT